MSHPSDSPPRLTWLLGRTTRQRLRLSQQLLATTLMACCVLILFFAALASGRPLTWVAVWGGLSMAGLVSMFVLIRIGWSERCRDPSLTEPQMQVALLSAASAYLLAGPVRALVIPPMMVVLVFGMFELRPGRALRMGWLALGALLGAQGLGLALALGHALHEELAHALLAAVAFLGVSVLAGRLSRIRHRLTDQREALNQALARIEQLATHDALTGLFNRRHGEELLRHAVRRHERSGSRLCVALIDLDHFKQINDRHGHAVGDAALRAFALAAQSCLRTTDTLVRWGGEEFLLLLDDSALDVAGQALERLREAVARVGVPVHEELLRIGFSAGLTMLRGGEGVEAALERADRALYQAKADGRGRTVQAP